MSKSTDNMKKAGCPYCGTPVNAFYRTDAVCEGVFFLCKNKECKKQFELKINR